MLLVLKTAFSRRNLENSHFICLPQWNVNLGVARLFWIYCFSWVIKNWIVIFLLDVSCSPEVPYIPHREELVKTFPSEDLEDINWTVPSHTFDRFSKLLPLPTYMYSILLGLTVSAGGLTESLVSNFLLVLLHLITFYVYFVLDCFYFLCFVLKSGFNAKLPVTINGNILRENMILCSYNLFYPFLIGNLLFNYIYINLWYVMKFVIFQIFSLISLHICLWKLLYLFNIGREKIYCCLFFS